MTPNNYRATLFKLFIAIVAVTAVVTLLGVVGVVPIKEGYLNTLFASLIVESVAAVVALFRSANFFGSEVTPPTAIAAIAPKSSPPPELAADAGLVSSSLLLLTESEPKFANDTERFLVHAYGLLLRRLRILDVNESGQLRPVSERADMFLRMVSDTAAQNIPFAGDWNAEGTQNESASRLGEILKRMETFRIEASGGLAKTSAIRKACSSLVFVKAMRGLEPVFLMKWSDAWGGYFWFVGGIQEASDKSPELCAQRELREELGLHDSAIQTISRLTNVSDKRISERQYVLTDYSYSLFSVALDESTPSGAALLPSEFTIQRTIKGGYQIDQKCKWLTWDQIETSPALIKDAGPIIDAISRYGVDRIPLSFRTLVS